MDSEKTISEVQVNKNEGQNPPVAADKRKKKRNKSERRKRKAIVDEPSFDIPGVLKLILSPEAQKFMGCIVGENVTSEKPWKYVAKDLFDDHMDLYEDSSEFLAFKPQIVTYPKDKLLIGYVPDESSQHDEFYICLTETAADTVAEMIDKIQKAQEARLQYAINKVARPWIPQGTETQIDDNIPKSNRPLLVVEVETEYPIMSSKVQFAKRLVGDVRDGYAEILPMGQPTANVFKSRIDAATQVAAPVRSTEAQTVCTYPTNAHTQYEYECTFDEKPSEEYKTSFAKYVQLNMGKISDFLRVNGTINLYVDDYSNLVTDNIFGLTPIRLQVKEYMSFTDITVCRGKTISSVAWHPMWSGTVAIAYADTALNSYLTAPSTVDEVENAVYGRNPVLLWSFMDAMNAKLLLEAHREVVALSFCPYDENILVGGCVNGQVIIWDIRNKLKHVEEEEVLTNEQLKYRIMMHSLLGWMKNIRDPKVVRATAVSDMDFSHKDSISEIKWLSNYWSMSKTGHVTDIPKDSEEKSLQFATCSRDGSVQFWDLLAAPTVQSGAFRGQRRLRRLKKRPSALTVDESPLRSLHRIFKPIYRVETRLPNEGDRLLPLSSISVCDIPVTYKERESNVSIEFKMANRILHDPVATGPFEEPKCQFVGGSAEGDFFIACWEGFDYSTGVVVNTENCKFTNFSKYHDGPIVDVSRASKYGAYLTVGGKVFAIWKDGFKNKPILWRKSEHNYTHGSFGGNRKAFVKLTRADGGMEVWNIVHQTDHFISEQMVSGKAILGSYEHPFMLKQSVIGMSDGNGSFRLFNMPTTFQHENEAENKLFSDFFERETSRKEEFMLWQTEWKNKHLALITQKQEEEIMKQSKKDEVEKEERKRHEEEQTKIEKEASKMASKLRPLPGKYSQWAKEQWDRKEEERMSKLLLAKKHLNKELLEKQHIPIKRFAEEKIKKKKKQEERLNEAQNIFNETVAVLFPDIVKEKPPPLPDPYASGDSIDDKTAKYKEYTEVSEEMQQFVEENPFIYNFDWKSVLNAGRRRRSAFDHTKEFHKKRHRLRKELRQAAAEQENISQQATGHTEGSNSNLSASNVVNLELQPVETETIEYGIVQ